MSFKVSRRQFLPILGIAVFSAAVAYAHDREVIHFAGASEVVVGQSVSVNIGVNEAPMSVTFTSVPAGLVSYTATLSSANATLSVPTNPNAVPGAYVLVATPTSGGLAKSIGVLANGVQ